MFKYLLFSFLSGAASFPPPLYWPRFESPYSGRSNSLIQSIYCFGTETLWIPSKCSDGTRIDDNEYLESLENGKELIVCTEEQKSRNYLSILI